MVYTYCGAAAAKSEGSTVVDRRLYENFSRPLRPVLTLYVRDLQHLPRKVRNFNRLVDVGHESAFACWAVSIVAGWDGTAGP